MRSEKGQVTHKSKNEGRKRACQTCQDIILRPLWSCPFRPQVSLSFHANTEYRVIMHDHD
jgi:hypothetical protein